MTLFGISDSFYTGISKESFQGLIQGNGVASSGFLLIIVLLIRALYHTNLIPPSESLILKTIYYLAGQIFIDDSDFTIMNSDREDIDSIVSRA